MPDTINSNKFGRRLWLLLVPLSLVACAFLAAVITYLFFMVREKQFLEAYSKELSSLQSEGLIISPTQFQADYEGKTEPDDGIWAQIEGDLNAESVRAKVAGVPFFDQDTSIEEAESFNTFRSWSNAAACVEFTDVCGEIIRKVKKAAARERIHRFQVKFDYIQTDLSGVKELAKVKQLLGLDAQVAIYLGDSDRAFEATIALFQLARHLQPVPYFESRLLEYALRRQALLILQRALELDLFSDEQLGVIDEYCKANSDLGTRWKVSLREEFGGVASLFVNPNLGMRDIDVVIPPRGEDGLFYLETMRKAWALPTEDWKQFRSNLASILIDFDSKTSDYWGSRKHELSRTLMPNLMVAANLFVSDAQLHRQARLVIAIRKYWRKESEFPVSLASLSLNPADEFLAYGNESFGYRIVDSRAVLWGFELGQTFENIPASYEDLLVDEGSRNRNRRLVWTLEPGLHQGP